PNSICRDEIGQFRASFPAEDAKRVATAKEITPDFWKRVTVLVSAGDNVRVGAIEIPLDDFEAKA
ncbi:MAG TPA: hypothetical protein VHU90_10100, partial [Galbitalea sp.]|nr:hypothetical protein [Galbitalea sp.]